MIDMRRAGIWKPRTRPGSFEGVGTKGLPWLQKAKQLTGLPVAVEVATGKQVDRKDKSLPDSDRSRMSVSVIPLPPGKYRVLWRALSADTHVTEGDFTFELAP